MTFVPRMVARVEPPIFVLLCMPLTDKRPAAAAPVVGDDVAVLVAATITSLPSASNVASLTVATVLLLTRSSAITTLPASPSPNETETALMLLRIDGFESEVTEMLPVRARVDEVLRIAAVVLLSILFDDTDA
ncbi:MAG: hypothetical protein AAFV88_17230, partial [Planctomycetota bacterium]